MRFHVKCNVNWNASVRNVSLVHHFRTTVMTRIYVCDAHGPNHTPSYIYQFLSTYVFNASSLTIVILAFLYFLCLLLLDHVCWWYIIISLYLPLVFFIYRIGFKTLKYFAKYNQIQFDWNIINIIRSHFLIIIRITVTNVKILFVYILLLTILRRT